MGGLIRTQYVCIIHTYVCIYIHTYIHAYTYILTYTHTYTHSHTHTHTYIHTHIPRYRTYRDYGALDSNAHREHVLSIENTF